MQKREIYTFLDITYVITGLLAECYVRYLAVLGHLYIRILFAVFAIQYNILCNSPLQALAMPLLLPLLCLSQGHLGKPAVSLCLSIIIRL